MLEQVFGAEERGEGLTLTPEEVKQLASEILENMDGG